VKVTNPMIESWQQSKWYATAQTVCSSLQCEQYVNCDKLCIEW